MTYPAPCPRQVRALESELQRVQSLIDNLAVKRQELSRQVAALTQAPEPASRRRHHHGSWIETDLDSMVTVAGGRAAAFDKDQPLFVNTFYDQQVGVVWISQIVGGLDTIGT